MASEVEVAKRQIQRQAVTVEYALIARDRAIERGDREHAAHMAAAAEQASANAFEWAERIPTGDHWA